MATKQEKHAIRRLFAGTVIFSQFRLADFAYAQRSAYAQVMNTIDDYTVHQIEDEAERWAKANCPGIGERCLSGCSRCAKSLDSIIAIATGE